jgi:ribosomal protein L29
MKKSAKAELRAKSLSDLQALNKDARTSVMQARFAKAAEGKAITIKQRDLRRQIARLETMIAEKSAQQGADKKAGAK